ncbi:hypothetical protein KR084_011763 [Drosophila pseudotakahashii]|nr:hypothetical protein KR084_011763 [Drosophila pseudotakahashii]
MDRFNLEQGNPEKIPKGLSAGSSSLKTLFQKNPVGSAEINPNRKSEVKGSSSSKGRENKIYLIRIKSLASGEPAFNSYMSGRTSSQNSSIQKKNQTSQPSENRSKGHDYESGDSFCSQQSLFQQIFYSCIGASAASKTCSPLGISKLAESLASEKRRSSKEDSSQSEISNDKQPLHQPISLNRSGHSTSKESVQSERHGLANKTTSSLTLKPSSLTQESTSPSEETLKNATPVESHSQTAKAIQLYYESDESSVDLEDLETLDESDSTRFYRQMVGLYSTAENLLKDFTKRKAVEFRERRNKKFPGVAVAKKK